MKKITKKTIVATLLICGSIGNANESGSEIIQSNDINENAKIASDILNTACLNEECNQDLLIKLEIVKQLLNGAKKDVILKDSSWTEGQ